MKNEMMIFNNDKFGEIRTTMKNGEPWFVGKDVAEALGYKDTVNALKQHIDADDKGTWCFTTSGQRRNMTTISESGVYALIFGSQLESAKEFKHWVTAEVLPSIRKTGSYTAPKSMTEYQSAMAQTRIENAKIRKARELLKLSRKYQGTTYAQVLDSYATKELTGELLLPLPETERKTYSATEIGEILGITANKVGQIANKNNLKIPEYGKWFHDKSRYSGKEVETFRYYDSVIPVIRESLGALSA